MVGVPGPNSGPSYGPLPVRTQPFSHWIGCLVAPENHLTEIVRSKPGRPIFRENATYPPFWAVLGLFACPTSRG